MRRARLPHSEVIFGLNRLALWPYPKLLEQMQAMNILTDQLELHKPTV